MRLFITFFVFLFSVSVFGQNTQSMDLAYGSHHNVYLEYSPDFNMSSFTISFDIYPRSYCWSGNSACESCPLSRYEYGPGHEVIRTGFDTNIFYVDLLNSDADILGVVYDSPLPLNVWTNIAFSYNNQVLNLYINGVLVDTANDMDFSINTSSTSGISIGELFAANGNWYNLDGLLDNVFIWNVLLNQEEINSVIECPIYSGEDGLITLFNFEEGEGNTVYDVSGNGNHGEVNGATWSTDVPEQNCSGDCTDAVACNFNSNADYDDGSCEYFTCKCLNGTVWSDELQGCIVENPTDTNLDGCTDLNDLMDILSAYGDCAVEEVVLGCTDIEAINYSEDANEDDGSCEYIFQPSEVDQLVFEYYLNFTSPSSCTTPYLEPGEYYLEFSGTWCGGSCWGGHVTDAAFDLNHPYSETPGVPFQVCNWTWNEYCPQGDNSCASFRPTPDVYNPDHIYYYPFTSYGGAENIYGISDECCWGDNSGGLTVKVFKIVN